MKRTIVALVLASMLPIPAQAQSAGGYASESFEAHANWLSGDSGKSSPLFRFVSVTRDEQVGKEADTIVQVGQARCSSSGTARSFFYSCETSGRLIFVKRPDFQIDAALRSASVVFRARGRTNKVNWTGRDEQPSPSWGLQGGERALVARASTSVGARVRGSVLSEGFSTRHRKARASLSRSVQAGAIYETGIGSFRVTGDSPADAWHHLRRAIDSL